MSTDDYFAEWAIFLAAVCGQTYVQYKNADGAFVVPQSYGVRHITYADSLRHIRERFGFILESPEAIVVAFRGTSSTADWISDAIATQKKLRYLKEKNAVHQGFASIYNSTRRDIHAALAGLHRDKPVYVTGHSLGAALATLCAIDLAENTNLAAPRLFTYGSPRVGDPAFAKLFADSIHVSYRIANPLDLVTHVPPSILQFPKQDKKYYYSHVQTLYPLPFPGGVRSSHKLGNYYAALAKLDPSYAEQLSAANPGFCP